MGRVNVLIAGGGVIGQAVAYALAQRGVSDILVVDIDLVGVYASSELNAGGARATWWQPVNIETCRSTLDFFRANHEITLRSNRVAALHRSLQADRTAGVGSGIGGNVAAQETMEPATRSPSACARTLAAVRGERSAR